MALYRLIARFTDHHKVYEPGDVIEWDGVPSRAFVPLDPEPAPEPAPVEDPAPEPPKRRGRPPKR